LKLRLVAKRTDALNFSSTLALLSLRSLSLAPEYRRETAGEVEMECSRAADTSAGWKEGV
jgi:hypothetical protein